MGLYDNRNSARGALTEALDKQAFVFGFWRGCSGSSVVGFARRFEAGLLGFCGLVPSLRVASLQSWFSACAGCWLARGSALALRARFWVLRTRGPGRAGCRSIKVVGRGSVSPKRRLLLLLFRCRLGKPALSFCQSRRALAACLTRRSTRPAEGQRISQPLAAAR